MKTRISVIFALTCLGTCLGGSLMSGCSPQAAETRPALETVARAEGDAVAARVNGTEIFASDVDLSAQEQDLVDEGVSLPKNNPEYRRILDELIDQRLLALDAQTQGLNAEREAKIRLAAARERILGNMRVERQLRDTVNEASIRRMYEEQAKLAARGDEIRARHILVADKAEADKLLKQLNDGGDFASLAQLYSADDGTKERGGDLGYFTQDMLNSDFTGPVFQAKPGSRIGPFESEFGWHIVEVQDRRPATQPSFEALKPKITNFMTFEAIQDLLIDLRANSDVVIVEETAPAPETEPDETDPAETEPADEPTEEQ